MARNLPKVVAKDWKKAVSDSTQPEVGLSGGVTSKSANLMALSSGPDFRSWLDRNPDRPLPHWVATNRRPTPHPQHKLSSLPSAELTALRRDKIVPDALVLSGNGDPNKAPASLVGVLGESRPIHTDLVRSLAYSPDGRWLASASFDRTLILWETAAGMPRRSLRGHTHWVTAVAFSKDSRIVVSASHDESLKLWSVNDDVPPITLQPGLGAIWGMAISEDGRFLAAGGMNGKVRIWKWGQWDDPLDLPTITGDVFMHFNGNRNAALAFSPDGEFLAISGGGTLRPKDAQASEGIPIRLYLTTNGKLARTLAGHDQGMRSAQDLAFSRDGKYLASFVQDDQAKVWDVASGQLITAGLAPLHQFGSLAFGPDGQTLAVGGSSGGIDLYNIRSQARERRTFMRHGHSWGMAFSPDGKTFAGGFYDGSVHFWDVNDRWKELHLERGHLHYTCDAAFSPDGRSILSAGDDSTLRRWDLAQPGVNQVVHRFSADDIYYGGFPAGHVSVAWSPDGSKFAVVSRGRGPGPSRLSVWDKASTSERFNIPKTPDCVIFSPDGKTIAGSCDDGLIYLWNAANGTELHQFSLQGSSSALAFSPDGSFIAAASYDKNILVLWNVVTGVQAHSWKDTAMSAAAYHPPHGKILATGHVDGTITLWDAVAGQKIRVLRGHSLTIRSLKFTPNGQILVSSADDGTIRMWNPDHDRAREVISVGVANRPLMIDLDPSGDYLAATGNSPVIFLLRIAKAVP